MKENELKVEYVPKEELKTYANNAKVHTPEQIEGIKKSIERFGFNDPVAVWKDNEIIEGHGRLLAAMEMDEVKEIPVIRLDNLTDKERKAYIIAHNKLTLSTNFDNNILGEELKNLIGDFDMTDFGFGDFELNILTGDFEPEPFDTALIDQYDADEDSKLKKSRVIISFEKNQEKEVAAMLGLTEVKKVLYSMDELIAIKENE